MVPFFHNVKISFMETFFAELIMIQFSFHGRVPKYPTEKTVIAVWYQGTVSKTCFCILPNNLVPSLFPWHCIGFEFKIACFYWSRVIYADFNTFRVISLYVLCQLPVLWSIYPNTRESVAMPTNNPELPRDALLPSKSIVYDLAGDRTNDLPHPGWTPQPMRL